MVREQLLARLAHAHADVPTALRLNATLLRFHAKFIQEAEKGKVPPLVSNLMLTLESFVSNMASASPLSDLGELEMDLAAEADLILEEMGGSVLEEDEDSFLLLDLDDSGLALGEDSGLTLGSMDSGNLLGDSGLELDATGDLELGIAEDGESLGEMIMRLQERNDSQLGDDLI